MSAIAFEIGIIVMLLLLNGVFAMSEMAVVSSRRVRLSQRAEAGHSGARAALALAEHPAEFLSAVQVGITLIGVLSGAFAGATIAEQLAAMFERVPGLAPYGEALGLTIVVTGITFLSLIIGELVPKRIALTRPEAIASLIARPVGVVARIFHPLVVVLTATTDLVLRLARVRATREPTVTEEEIRAMVEQGAVSGIIQKTEHEIVESAFRLGDRTAASIMTPRPDMNWIDLAGSPEAIRVALAAEGDTRLVVCEGNVENVLGILHTEGLLARALAGEPIELPGDLRRAIRSPLFVPGVLPVYRLLEEFRRSRQQVAIVLDEFGGVDGVVTIDDILEALVGEYADSAGTEEPVVVRRADGSLLVDGSVLMDDLDEELDLVPVPADDRAGFRTVAGLILTRLGRLPRTGDAVEWSGHRFEVVDMDGRRIDKVAVTRI